MKTFLWIFLSIDFIMLLVCLYEAFAVSSNKSMLTVNLSLIALIGLALWLRVSNPKLALLFAGLPASLLIIYAIIFLITASGNRWN
ncbi:MAG: hypothetical protein ABI851_14750 [Saprospiraceae bacterium]